MIGVPRNARSKFWGFLSGRSESNGSHNWGRQNVRNTVGVNAPQKQSLQVNIIGDTCTKDTISLLPTDKVAAKPTDEAICFAKGYLLIHR